MIAGGDKNTQKEADAVPLVGSQVFSYDIHRFSRMGRFLLQQKQSKNLHAAETTFCG